MAELNKLELMRVRLLEEQLGVPITQYTAEEWLTKALASEEEGYSAGCPNPLWWFQTSRYQETMAFFAEKLAQ